jgi:tagatose 1,6-diphosphate aldolase GatY/KbaY
VQVADFLIRSGAQLLAVAIGNVHERYTGEPRLRWYVLHDITSRTSLAVVLHGAFGLAAQDLAQA